MKNYAMTGKWMNVPARLMAAGLLLGLLGAGQVAEAAKSSPLPEKLQGSYGPFSLLYFVNGKAQKERAPVARLFVEVGSAGLVPVDFSQVVFVTGVPEKLVFTEGLKPASVTANEGTVSGNLLTDAGEFTVSKGDYKASLDGAGLRLIVQLSGSVVLRPAPAPADKVAAPARSTEGHVVINILLRKAKVR